MKDQRIKKPDRMSGRVWLNDSNKMLSFVAWNVGLDGTYSFRLRDCNDDATIHGHAHGMNAKKYKKHIKKLERIIEEATACREAMLFCLEAKKIKDDLNAENDDE